MYAKTTADTIDVFLVRKELNSKKSVELWFDWFASVTGYVGGVQKVKRGNYRKALLFSLCIPSFKPGGERSEWNRWNP